MNIQEIITANNLQAIYVSNLDNVKYLSKFSGSEAALLITIDKNYLLVDSRYTQQAKMQALDFEIIDITQNGFFASLKNILLIHQVTNLGFEGSYLTFDKYDLLTKALSNINLVNINIDSIRQIKTESEIAIIKEACKITDLAYKHILDYVQVGMSEQQVNLELTKFILDQGCSGMSFDTIVASGQRSSLPHGVASDKKIAKNDFLTLDFGVYYKGYVSDMTRTFCVGLNPDPKLEEIYQIVKEAQAKAIEAIKPGIRAKDLDAVARDYISDKGYGDYFGHGLGHSIGLVVHESPLINKKSYDILQPGMIITIEPGIYIPQLGGVRIEDDVLITKDGYEVLTHSTKELLKLERD